MVNQNVIRARAIQHWLDAIDLWKKLKGLPQDVQDVRDGDRVRQLRESYMDEKAEHLVRALELAPDLFGVGPLDPRYRFTVRVTILEPSLHLHPAEKSQFLNTADLVRALGGDSWSEVKAAIEQLYAERPALAG